MKEKIIQGGIVNGVKMLVCPTWEEDFQNEIHKTGGCLRISMNYSAVDVSYWNDKINKQESDNVSYVGINMYEYENYKETLKSGDIPVEENERGIVNILKKNNYRIIFK